jgi:hypothetical protein
MAKSPRTPESLSRKVSSSALRITDEFCNLKEVHRAFACLQGLLSPIHRTTHHEEFSIEPGDLRALVAVINAELERRTEPVEAAIRSLGKALKAQAL